MFLLDFVQALGQAVISRAFVAICNSLKHVPHSFIVFLLFVERFSNVIETLIEVIYANMSGSKPAALLICT